MANIQDRLRASALLRFNSTPLSEFVPMCQEAADRIDALERENAKFEASCAADGQSIAKLEAEVARLRVDESRLSLEWNKHLLDILGRPNFTCANIAEVLRRGGATIPRNSEDEQAHVLHYLLCHYAKHGDKWIEKANEGLAEIRKSIDAAKESA